MELWKVHKYCETASLKELVHKELELREAVDEKRISDTNAKAILAIVQEYIELKRLFD